MGLFSKIKNGLKKTKDAIASKISFLFHGEINDEFYEELEFALISSDIGTKATDNILDRLKQQVKSRKIKSAEVAKDALRDVMIDILSEDTQPLPKPCLITFVGVNGVGKTTTIGKVAHQLKTQGNSVVMVAADTFRAAATEQLTLWNDRAKTRIVKYSEGADPGAVVYDGIKSAIAKKDDYCLIDTAGRLQNKTNLMEELKKIYKIINREWTSNGLAHQNWLVIDATVGQNALSQVQAFNEVAKVDGIILTKIDGTAKGGIIFAIKEGFNIPVRFIGVGEAIDDLEPFNPKEFVEGII